MQIGSLTPGYPPSVGAQQDTAPPIQSQPGSVQRKDKDGDADNSATRAVQSSSGNANGHQVNVVA